MNPRLDGMTVAQAQQILNVSKGMIHKLIRQGRLNVVAREPFAGGTRFLIDRRDVRRMKRERAGL